MNTSRKQQIFVKTKQMPTLLSKLPNVGDTIFSQMNAVANEVQAINLGQGFPDYQPDSDLLDVVCQAMMRGPNQYAPMIGVPALRQAIANKVLALQGRQYDVDQEITVTSGASEALSASILALVHPADEVVLIDPAYDLYAPMVTLAGGKTVRVAMTPPGGGQSNFALDWDAIAAAINRNTRLLVLNFPHNPSGLTLRDADLDALEQLAAQHPFLILLDEAYEHIVFDERAYCSPVARPQLAERCVLVSSFAKTLQITGWKIGYCCAPAAISKEIRKVHQYMVFSVNTPLQQGIATYLSQSNATQTLSPLYQRKRDRLVQGLSKTRLQPLRCEGTFFLLVDTSKLGDQQERQMAIRLAREAGVATIPVSAFYENPQAAEANHQLLRFCFAKQDATLDAAIERLSVL
ncbi:methionine aminotransferase [Castellaniella sp.]|uniref:methionine aminotransferase n=1 Tax=Castellaniella sp. TaxID=1955812 RepID=UPI002B001E55|nr:methionine aminotransferase [Castellaniella sp.]